MNKKHFQQEGKLSSSFYNKIPSENIMAQEALISFCGINCLDCPAYIAKRTDDMELRAKTAKAWSGPEFSVKQRISIVMVVYQRVEFYSLTVLSAK